MQSMVGGALMANWVTIEPNRPVPLHQQKAYAGLGYGPGSVPLSERIAARLLSLPMFPNLKLSQQARVVEQVREWIGRRQNAAVMA